MRKDMKTEDLDSQGYEKWQMVWEKGWSRPDFSPSFRITKIPAEIQEAVESGWFPAGASLLDIGCGSGEIAAWLAERNFNVLGIDFSQSAIQKAKSAASEMPGRLEFKVVDVCRDTSASPQFNALLDRACLHGLPKTLYSDYVKTVASWAIPGARFLLLCGINQGVRREEQEEKKLQEQMIDYLESVFSPMFEIRRVEATFLERRPPKVPAPGLAVWMIRRPSAESHQ